MTGPTLQIGERLFTLSDGEWCWLHPSHKWGIALTNLEATLFTDGHASVSDVEDALKAMNDVERDIGTGRVR